MRLVSRSSWTDRVQFYTNKEQTTYIMGEQYVYLLRLVKDDYELPHVKAFVDADVAEFHFKKDVIYYRKKGWEVEEDMNVCGVNAVHRASMVRKEGDGYDRATLLLERYEITKK